MQKKKRSAAVFVARPHRGEIKTGVEDGKGEGGDRDHPDRAMLDKSDIVGEAPLTFRPERGTRSPSASMGCPNRPPSPEYFKYGQQVPQQLEDLLPTDRCTG